LFQLFCPLLDNELDLSRPSSIVTVSVPVVDAPPLPARNSVPPTPLQIATQRNSVATNFLAATNSVTSNNTNGHLNIGGNNNTNQNSDALLAQMQQMQQKIDLLVRMMEESSKKQGGSNNSSY